MEIHNYFGGEQMKAISKVRVELAIFVLLAIQPILDIISYFAIGGGFTTITTLFRLMMFAAVMLYAFIISEQKKSYIIMGGILGIYWCIHMYVCARTGYISFVEDAGMFLRTIQMPAMTLAFITFFEKSEKLSQYIGKVFVVNYITITSSIIVSFLIGRPQATYESGVGIKGWFAIGNAQSCIISVMALLALCYAYRTKKRWYFVAVLIMIMSNLYLFGTRVAYFSIFITCIAFIALLIWNRQKRWDIYGVLIVGMVICGALYEQSPCYENRYKTSVSMDEWDETIDEIEGETVVEGIEQYRGIYELYCADLVERFGLEKVVEVYDYSEEARDVIDNRKKKINFGKLLMNEKDDWSRLFGCEYQEFAVGDGTLDPENDFPAIYYFYGYVGLGMYALFLLYFIAKLAKNVLKNITNISLEKGALGISLVLMLGVAQYSGNV